MLTLLKFSSWELALSAVHCYTATSHKTSTSSPCSPGLFYVSSRLSMLIVVTVSIFNTCFRHCLDKLYLLDFPWSLNHILPFWSGAEHHDFHHMAFTNNFSTSFRWWDRIFGTDIKYREYRCHVERVKTESTRCAAAWRCMDERH